MGAPVAELPVLLAPLLLDWGPVLPGLTTVAKANCANTSMMQTVITAIKVIRYAFFLN
jgi:hypothetical protein